ncbi:response regulator PleD [bacterium BMS3Bbin12]|nr:response regulator PleD [bacterium BMS3Bbin12]GBE51228.1 response regulator PleD [bacterium BMS3Bbin13]
MTCEIDDAGTAARILVVDDSRVMRAAFAKILGGEFDLANAADGEQGWEALAGDPDIRVVITDADMPRLDGYGLIARIRGSADPRLRALPVIMVTGADDAATRERALAAGTTDFVTKPLDPLQLRARIRTHARLDRTQRELAATAEALEAQSAVDPITGLSNRRHLLEHGAQELSFARRHYRPLALIVFAVDGFRALRERHGAAASRALLEWTAGILRGRMRTEDTVARIAEDEFAVLAPATNRLQAAVLCKRLQIAFRDPPFRGPEGPMPVTVSLALVNPGREHTESFELHLEWACRQVAAARAAGGDRLLLGDRPAPAPALTPVPTSTPAPIPTPIPTQTPTPLALTPPPPTLDAALDLLAHGQGARLDPHLPTLLARLLPLLEYADRHMGPGPALGGILPALRARLDGRGIHGDRLD